MSKNVRISLYILIPIIIWMISGQFVDDSAPEIKERNGLTSVIIAESSAAFFAPKITLNASATSEKRVRVMAKLPVKSCRTIFLKVSGSIKIRCYANLVSWNSIELK